MVSESPLMYLFRLIGILYVLSGLWCAYQPGLAATFLGYQLIGDLGKAEFFSVYGGLQVGIGIAILASSWVESYRLAACFFAALLSLGLFSFRLLSFFFIEQSAPVMFMLGLEGSLALALLFLWRRQAELES